MGAALLARVLSSPVRELGLQLWHTLEQKIAGLWHQIYSAFSYSLLWLQMIDIDRSIWLLAFQSPKKINKIKINYTSFKKVMLLVQIDTSLKKCIVLGALMRLCSRILLKFTCMKCKQIISTHLSLLVFWVFLFVFCFLVCASEWVADLVSWSWIVLS